MDTVSGLISSPLEAPQSLKAFAGVVFDQMDIASRTNAQYKAEIGSLIEWLGGRSLQSSTLLDWKKHLRSRTDLATSTKAKQLTLAKIFFRELYRHGAIPKDISVGVRGFKVNKLHKRQPISDEQLKSILGYLKEPGCDIRLPVIIALMYRQGLRRLEVARLIVEDFDHNAKTLRILGKGKEDFEPIDLHPLTFEAVTSYLKTTKLKSGSLFPSPYKEGESLTSNAIYRLVTRMHTRLGISASPHSYRHKFVSRLIQRSNLNILEVATYSRHQSVETVRVYYQRLDKQSTLPQYYEAMADS